MNCGQCQDLLVEYSLGELGRSDANEVDAHLSGGCESCQRELVEVQEVLAMLGTTLEPVSPAPHVKRALLDRIETKEKLAPATIPISTRQPARSAVWKAVPYAAAVLSGFFVGAVATRYSVDHGLAGSSRESQLAALVDSARQKFGSPQVQFAALHPVASADAVVGHLMWDARGRSLHFFAFDLQPPAEGHQFAVWYRTDGGKSIHAGELTVSPRGNCSAIFNAPPLEEPVTAIAVTEERLGDVAQPRGPVRIVADFAQPAANSR